jgi:hypothetical protein
MSNVITLPARRRPSRASANAWAALTWRLLLEQHRRGELPPALLEYLMLGSGLRP